MSRQAVDDLARREYEHAREKGKEISYEDARKKAIKIATEVERDKQGLTKTYRDGERP